MDQHQSDRARLGSDAHRLCVRRAADLDRQRRRFEADGVSDLVLSRLRLESRQVAGRPASRLRANMGGAAVRSRLERSAYRADRRGHHDDAEVRRPAQARTARHGDVQPGQLSRGGNGRRAVRLASCACPVAWKVPSPVVSGCILRTRDASGRGGSEPERAVRRPPPGTAPTRRRAARRRTISPIKYDGCSTATRTSRATTTCSSPAASGIT